LKVDWNEFDHLLGVKSDREIAILAGCTSSNVRQRRNKRGLPPVVHACWTEEDVALLTQGQMRCVQCESIQSVECFHQEKGRKAGRKRQCKNCTNTKKRKERMHAKSQYVADLGGKCQNCFYDLYLTPMQFHHVFSPTKEHTLSRIMRHESRKRDVMMELDKCCLLCSNCHDAYHASEIELEFVKQSFGWTVKHPRKVGLLSKEAPTEDRGKPLQAFGDYHGLQ